MISFRKNEGVVLLMVLLISIILMAVGVSMMFSSLNQSKTTSAQVDEIQCEEYNKTMLAMLVSQGMGIVTPVTKDVQIGSKKFSVTITKIAGTPPVPDRYKITCRPK